MTQNLISVHDRVANIFFPPFVAPNDQAAVRQLVQAQAAAGPLRDNFDDYAFIVIATMDMDKGLITPCPHRQLTVPKALPLAVDNGR